MVLQQKTSVSKTFPSFSENTLNFEKMET